jgi:hypothetical protein
MAKHRKVVSGPCAYCDQEGRLTRDHVLPQCLFQERIPLDIPVVYTCRQCNNNEKSQDDTYLRDMLARDGLAVASDVVQAIRQGAFCVRSKRGILLQSCVMCQQLHSLQSFSNWSHRQAYWCNNHAYQKNE